MVSCFQRFPLVLLLFMSGTALVKLAPFLKDQIRVQDSPAFPNYYQGDKSTFEGHNSGSGASPNYLRGGTLNAADRDGKRDDGVKYSKGRDVDRYNDVDDSERNRGSREELDNEDGNGGHNAAETDPSDTYRCCTTGCHDLGHGENDAADTMELIPVISDQPRRQSDPLPPDDVNSIDPEVPVILEQLGSTSSLPNSGINAQQRCPVLHISCMNNPPAYQINAMDEDELLNEKYLHLPPYVKRSDAIRTAPRYQDVMARPPCYCWHSSSLLCNAGYMDWIRRFQRCVSTNCGRQLDLEHPCHIVKCGVCLGIYLVGCSSAGYLGYKFLGCGCYPCATVTVCSPFPVIYCYRKYIRNNER